MPRGAARDDVEGALLPLKIIGVEVADADPAPDRLRVRLDEHWYRLRRD